MEECARVLAYLDEIDRRRERDEADIRHRDALNALSRIDGSRSRNARETPMPTSHRQFEGVIEGIIDQKVGEVRVEGLDLSFGEIISLLSNKEVDLYPDFQRYFRWSEEQRSRLIESILLGLPIPQLFFVETDKGVWELIDGLQRICSVIQFIQPELIKQNHLQLAGCDIIPELNGKTLTDLPLALRLKIKRSPVRTVVIKKQSTKLLRYSMFKRLNTGGEALSAQEIRNCQARMLGDEGAKFYKFIRSCAESNEFRACTEPMAENVREKLGDEELVLRFFALKNASNLFKGSIQDWLDRYLDEVILGSREFDYQEEQGAFTRLFSFLNSVLGEGAFVKYKNNLPTGGLAPAYYEAVTMGTFRVLDQLVGKDKEMVKQAIIAAVQTADFRSQVGPGANSILKLERRIKIVEKALSGI